MPALFSDKLTSSIAPRYLHPPSTLILCLTPTYSLSQGLYYQIQTELEGGRKSRGAMLEVNLSEQNSAGISVPSSENNKEFFVHRLVIVR